MKTFLIEMRGQAETRVILADSFATGDGWCKFYRQPPQGGHYVEYVRVCEAEIISMETKL